MRITHNMLISNFLRNLNSIARRIERSQQQLATGVKFSRPSDGPIETGQILGFQATSARIGQYIKNVDDGSSQVTYIDSILQAVNADIRLARDNAVHAANDSLNREDRIAIGKEINQLLESTLGNSNSRFQDRFVFAGWKTASAPFQAVYNERTGEIEDVIYAGDRGVIERMIGDSEKLTVNLPGDVLFANQTYSLQGKSLPANSPLGFKGTLFLNGVQITVSPEHSLTDIARAINKASSRSLVTASISDNALLLESKKAVGRFTISDDRENRLLENLGLYVSGAFNRGTTVPALPITDSTPAVFDAAGPVANLVYDNTNNVLNIFLGADANNGVSKAANIYITPGTYASVDDLIAEIQKQIDAAFGADRIIVSDSGGGTLRLETAATGDEIDAGDLVIGGTYFGVQDTASNSTNLNLVAVAGNAPPTPAGTPGTDGNDKFIIDLGPTTSKTGADVPPQTIDLRGSAITTIDDLVNEIRYQIFRNDVLRGAVEVTIRGGFIHFETVNKGPGVLASDFKFSEGATGTLAALGISDIPIRAMVTGSTPVFPFIVVAGFNDTVVIDLGPSVSSDGIDSDPVTLHISPGIYNDITTIFNELQSKIQANMLLKDSVEINVYGPPGAQYMVLSSIKAGSGVRGEDLKLSGSLIGTLGFPAGDAHSGGGTADGRGIEILPSNIFNTLISLRDDCYGVVGLHSKLLSAQNQNQQILGLIEGDFIMVNCGATSGSFRVLAGDTFENLIRSIQNILGSRARVTLTTDGRIRVENLETSQITGFSITAFSAAGTSRETFNEVFSMVPAMIPGLGTATSLPMLDPLRYKRLGQEDLEASDVDLQNVLSHLAIVGARANRLAAVSSLFTASDLNIKELRTSIESINYAELVTLLSQQQLVLQSALTVGAKILPQSLLDFLL